MKKHVNIPVFIPHLGCPNMCVFCNQKTISGVKEFDAEQLDGIITSSLATVPRSTETEIAFFGGSFTGIDRSLMISLLKTAHKYVLDGRVSSIRCSTRPDYINEEILHILAEYGVKVIELGLQSISERVLRASRRGHSVADSINACKLIVNSGFGLVGQMMVGLPSSNIDDEVATAEFIAASGAVGARIYPTVVFRDTELCRMAASGEYTPLGLQDAVSRSAEAFSVFVDSGIEVIRIGLCASENLSSDETYYAGPNHPALGELVLNRYFYNKMVEKAKSISLTPNDVLKITVSPSSLSKAIGQNKINKLLLKEKLNVKDIVFTQDKSLGKYDLILITNGG